jgi:iron complex outermembrane receptor protein
MLRIRPLTAILSISLALSLLTSGASAQSITAADPIADADQLPGEPPPAAEASGAAPDADAAGDVDKLLNMDIDQLGSVDVSSPMMGEEVTTVTRQPSTVGKSPAAVFVITPEMIARSGATTIPDVLRMAPGVQVAQIDANKWAISIRGFNNLYAGKLLVQIDGRVVYSQFFSGVIWSNQDVVLQDVERIEVIRGPGATVWGSNAVNGVINIITKPAIDTQGWLVMGGAGTEQRDLATIRYGGQVGDDFHYRIFGKQFQVDDGVFPGGGYDDWHQERGGARCEWTPSDEDTITAQGQVFDSVAGNAQTFAFPTAPFVATPLYDSHDFGQDFLVRWTHVIDDESDWSVQAYYDNYGRVTPFANLNQRTYDVDFLYRFPIGDSHNVVCGTEYRRIDDHFFGDFGLSLDPVRRSTNLFSYFVQDEMTLVEDEWYFIAGSKFEHNSFTHFEYQPSVRLLHTPSERESVWVAISRAVRTPNRFEEGLELHQFAGPGPTFVEIEGNRAIQSEDLLAYEVGYRTQATDNFSWDVALFYNDYTDLTGTQPNGAPFFDPTIPAFVVPLTLANNASADTYGGELVSTYQVNDDWLITGCYSLLYMDVHAPAADIVQGSSPVNQVYLRSSWDIREDWQLDVIGRYVDNLPALDVPSYTTMDVRLAWRPIDNLEWAVVGRNLVDSPHTEFVDSLSGIVGTQVPPQVFTTLTWTY